MQTINEFNLIKKYFQEKTLSRSDVILGIGDDAALLKCLPLHELVVSTDTLVHPDIAKMTQEELDQLAAKMNRCPRKCLGYKTPQEVFFQQYKNDCRI